MSRHRSHSLEFKRRVVQECLAGETLHGLSKRHDISRELVRVWIEKSEAGAFDDDAHAADLIQQYEARISALERLVGKQAVELEFLKGAVRSTAREKRAYTYVAIILDAWSRKVVGYAIGRSIDARLAMAAQGRP